MADALAFVLLYVVVFGFWMYLAIVLSLVVWSMQRRLEQLPPGALRTRDLWPDANCFFPWRLWW
jgi:hypothetical protein